MLKVRGKVDEVEDDLGKKIQVVMHKVSGTDSRPHAYS